MSEHDNRPESNIPKVVLISFSKYRVKQLYSNIKSFSSTPKNKIAFSNGIILENPNCIIGLLDEGYSFANDKTVAKIIDKFAETNYDIKAIYADCEDLQKPAKKKSTPKITSPVFFLNPPKPIPLITTENIYQDVLANINSQYIVYYYPEKLFTHDNSN